MFDLRFYETKRGDVPIADYLDELKKVSSTNKDARINRRKILAYMAALSEKGTLLGEPYVKPVVEDIWELRPLKNRIFFFFWKDDTYVLLHHFIKKTKKTPKKEIQQAINNRNDWLERNE